MRDLLEVFGGGILIVGLLLIQVGIPVAIIGAGIWVGFWLIGG